jgi:protein-L-isoaspartate(D-aspartate) O-methyltransferase
MKPSPPDPRDWERDQLVRDHIQAPGVIRDPRILDAMRRVPRHEFLPQAERDAAYEDHPLPIGHGQTISQPSLVAWMTQAVEPEPSHRILEIGTGSGYQAAILAHLAREVFSIEILPELAGRALSTFARLGIGNVHVRTGDGYYGWPEAAPFDSIIVTCCPEAVPPPLVKQLKEGGRVVIPVGSGASQTLLVLRKENGQLHETASLPVRFVPMTGRARET